MLKTDVCLEMLFTELPYEKRIEAIAKSGFQLIEFWFHDATFDGKCCSMKQAKDTKTLRQVCEANGVKVNNMVVNAPDGSFGGAPVDAGDLGKYLERVEEVIQFSGDIGCDKAITCSGNSKPSLSRKKMRENLEKALFKAADIAASSNFTLLLEPLNTYVDHPGYYLDSSQEAAEIVRTLKKPNLKLLYDIYHMQIMEGNIIATIERNIDIIGHFHSAGVPGRHEIINGEVNYAEILKKIYSLGYNGNFGLEYFPSICDNAKSLSLTRDFLVHRQV
ncbi:MAG: TIM barrel protein [Candidatus Omnitrophica bacterium]|nr:TIM barrel protein [Candidatus Omnitrophota bacterium]